MAADTNFQQKIQPLGAEEQRGACEVSGREFRLGSSGLKGRHEKLQTLRYRISEIFNLVKKVDCIYPTPTNYSSHPMPHLRPIFLWIQGLIVYVRLA